LSNIRSIFEVGRRALNVQQVLLDRAAHNIANVNTDGYSRQRVILKADSLVINDKKTYGGGVNVLQVERINDQFVEKQIRTQNQTLGWLDTYKSTFDRIESIINEPSDSGISSAITKFFDAWHELSTDPESGVSRQAVIMRGHALSQAFHGTHGRILDLKAELYSEFDGSVSQFNEKLDQLAYINRVIKSDSQNGANPELLDERDLILQDLSKMADINIAEDDFGAVMVSHNGNVILQNVNVTHLQAGNNPDDISTVKWENSNGPAHFSNGRFAAFVEMHSTRLDDIIGELDTLAMAIVNKVNEQHKLGTSVETLGQTGYNYFSPESTGASNIGLAEEIKDNALKISASLDGNSGDGANALAISQLVKEKVLFEGTARFHDYYSNTVAQIGAESAHYQTMAEGQELFIEQLKIKEEAVSGVSLDEEMTNLIQFQRSYQAAARVISAADEMLEVLLNTF
jgi:flagellar hook-associated protein 1